jgi:hypothetical protein
MHDPDPALPPYTYIPGGPWPHPISDPAGHSHGRRGLADDDAFERGVALFDAGFYWEAHEAWEALWHAHGRRGPTADVLKALIKLAAAGVKVRQGQPHGVRIHATRAARLLAEAAGGGAPSLIGLDLVAVRGHAERIAADPPRTDLTPADPAAPVLGMHLADVPGTTRPGEPLDSPGQAGGTSS